MVVTDGRRRGVDVAALARSGSSAFSCRVDDLSRESAFLRTDKRLPEGAPLEIDFAKPGGARVVRVRAVVLRAGAGSDPAHHGLEVAFTTIAGEDRDLLGAWLGEGAPPDGARMMLQIKGLLMEIDDLRAALRARDGEIEELKRRLAVAETLIGRRKAE